MPLPLRTWSDLADPSAWGVFDENKRGLPPRKALLKESLFPWARRRADARRGSFSGTGRGERQMSPPLATRPAAKGLGPGWNWRGEGQELIQIHVLLEMCCQGVQRIFDTVFVLGGTVIAEL